MTSFSRSLSPFTPRVSSSSDLSNEQGYDDMVPISLFLSSAAGPYTLFLLGNLSRGTDVFAICQSV